MIGNEVASHHVPKAKVRLSTKCPICNQSLQFGIETPILNQVDHYPFPHIVIHGDPLHAVIAYIDRELQVRAVESAYSLEILREGATFSQLLQKWSNPF